LGLSNLLRGDLPTSCASGSSEANAVPRRSRTTQRIADQSINTKTPTRPWGKRMGQNRTLMFTNRAIWY
jgi:hypothetical protein